MSLTPLLQEGMHVRTSLLEDWVLVNWKPNDANRSTA